MTDLTFVWWFPAGEAGCGLDLTQRLPHQAVSGPQAGCSLKAVSALTRILQKLFVWQKDQTPCGGFHLLTPARSHPLFSSSPLACPHTARLSVPSSWPLHRCSYTCGALPSTSQSQLRCHSLPGPLSPWGVSLLFSFMEHRSLLHGMCDDVLYYYLWARVLSVVSPPPPPIVLTGRDTFMCLWCLGQDWACSRCSVNLCWMPDIMLWLTLEPSFTTTLGRFWAKVTQVPG